MKSNRLLAFVLALVLSFGLAACNNRPATTTPTTTTPTTTAPATTAPATTAPATAPATTPAAGTTAPTTGTATTGTATTPGATTTPAAGATTPATTTTTGTATTTDPVTTTVEGAADDVAEGVENAADAVTGATGEVSAALGTARRNAVQELESLNLDTQTDETVQDAQVAVATARQNLQNAYQGAGDTATAEWQELETEFDRVEQSLETGAANALAQVRALITRLQQGLN